MPRRPRSVAVDYPHHITQRGNYRQAIFSDAEDYAQYLKWLARYTRQYGLEIWAYCLMPNHVHFVGVPRAGDALARTFNTVHMQYAQYYNQKSETKGHLWQGRFFSCVLDERHTYAAVRYVELNPVRSKMVASPEEYPWSSARSHITRTPDPVLSGCFLTETVTDWRRYLGEENDPEAQKRVIQATQSGHPCGEENFVKKMETTIGRRLAPLPVGRPRGSIKTNKSKDREDK
jgi:putative transposase